MGISRIILDVFESDFANSVVSRKANFERRKPRKPNRRLELHLGQQTSLPSMCFGSYLLKSPNTEVLLEFRFGPSLEELHAATGVREIANRKSDYPIWFRAVKSEQTNWNLALIETSWLHTNHLRNLVSYCKAIASHIDSGIFSQTLADAHSQIVEDVKNDSLIISWIKYFGITVGRFLVKALRRSLHLDSHKWSVHFKVSGADIVDIPNPRGACLADPFLLALANQSFIVFERYNYKSNRGSIWGAQISKSGPIELHPVLAEPFHLSFPFVFAFGGKVWLMPEATESGGTRLYEITLEAGRLQSKFVRKYEELPPLVDPVVRKCADGSWELTGSPDFSGTSDYSSCSQTWVAHNPVIGPWEPLKKGLTINSSFGRNAGLIETRTSAFTVRQIHGFDSYGLSISAEEQNLPKLALTLKNIGLSFESRIHHIHETDLGTAWDQRTIGSRIL